MKLDYIHFAKFKKAVSNNRTNEASVESWKIFEFKIIATFSVENNRWYLRRRSRENKMLDFSNFCSFFKLSYSKIIIAKIY